MCNPSPDIDNTSQNGPENINSTGNPVDILTAYLNHNDQLSFAGRIEVIGGVVTVTKGGSLSTRMSGNLN